MEEMLEHSDFAERPLAMDDRLSPTAETDESRLATNEQTLLAMADWDRLAQRGSISGSLAESNEPAITANEFARFRAGKDSLFGVAITELAAKEPSDPPIGRPGASAAAASHGDPSGHRTLYWHPRLKADSNGVCRVHFPIPHSPLALRLVVLSHSGQKVGSATKLIPTVVETAPN